GWCGSWASPVSVGTLLLGRRSLLVGHDRGLHAQMLLHLGFDLKREIGMVLEIQLGVLAALADPLLAVAVPGARLLDDPRLRGDVHEERFVADPLVEQ